MARAAGSASDSNSRPALPPHQFPLPFTPSIVGQRCPPVQDFVAYEDPLPTADIEGYVELCRALDVLRFIVDNMGGITGGMKIAALAECFGMGRIRTASNGYVYTAAKPGPGYRSTATPWTTSPGGWSGRGARGFEPAAGPGQCSVRTTSLPLTW